MTCTCGTRLANCNPGPLCYACSARKFAHHVKNIDLLGPLTVHIMPSRLRNEYMTREEAKRANAMDLAVKRATRLAEFIGADTGYTATEVLQSRLHATAKYRQIIALILSQEFAFSAKIIGHALQTDHATILHGLKRARERMATDAQLAGLVAKWRAELLAETKKKEAV